MDAIGHYVSRFNELQTSGAAADFLADARRKAIERFAQLGFPGPKDEEWRATSVAPIASVPFEPATRAALSQPDFERLVPRALREMAGPQLVFVNGLFDEKLSTRALLQGVEVTNLAQLLAKEPARLQPYLAMAGQGEQAFGSLNAAFFRDGAFVLVRDQTSFEQPIQLISIAVPGEKPVAAMPRSVVLVGAGAKATLVETFVSQEGASFTDALTQIRLGDGASLEHYRLEREGRQAFHAGRTEVEQGRDSRYRSFSIADGGALARHDLDVKLAGEGASCALDGLSLASGKQLIDHHTFVDHAFPHCSSEELYKGILDGQARAVFQGRVLVRPGAQKTDAKQSNRNLLLSPTAQANSKPQLEIHADDVKCTHGAAVGQLDREALFYLRSRGIGEGEARSLLTEAFAGEVLARMSLAPVKELLQTAVRERTLRACEEVA
ncbi:MAG TPA: Fe-S cluster assembly protein SufD [Myxococcales bacterium]